MCDDKIHIPARRLTPVQGNRPVVRISAKAYEALADIYNESTLSMSQIASLLIIESAKRVVYDKEV